MPHFMKVFSNMKNRYIPLVNTSIVTKTNIIIQKIEVIEFII